MDRATFFKHFDLLADQPDAVAKMRALIWQLAVQGKLLSQNPKDEPAEILLDHVRSEKQRLAKAAGQKPPKAWPKIKPDELAFKIPKTWVATRFGELAINIEAGFSPQCEGRRRTEGEWGVLKISAVSWDAFDPEENKALPANIEPRPELEVCDGDFLMSRANTAELVAKSVVVYKPPGRLLLNDKTLRVHFTKHIERRFVNLVNNSLSSRAYYATAAAGTSSSMKNITREAIAMLPIGLPPLAEQQRILTKVDELMALCDELSARQQSQHDAGVQFQRSALHHLTTASDQKSFSVCWQRVCAHFNQLHDSPDAITQLRQTILQLAVQGCLGTQDRKDEPAKKLVERAQAQWPERKVSDRQSWQPEEPPCDLPEGWVWTCLDVLGNTNPRNEADDDMEVAFTPMKFISAEYGRPAIFETRPWAEVKKGFTHFANNDVVLAKITPCFENGKSAVMRGLKNGIGAGTTELHVFRGYGGCVLPDYALLFLKTSHFIETGVPRMTGSAGQKRVPWDYFANSPFPLPPLTEQKRIVARVDELMQQCDVLEAQLTESSTLGTHLLDSTIHHLFTGNQAGTELAVSSGRSNK